MTPENQYIGRKQSVSGGTLSDPDSWVEQYGDYLYSFTLTRIQDPTVAEDLVQETFLGALKARENFQGHSSERTWLTSILKHKIVDHFRKTSKEQTIDDQDFSRESIDEYFNENGKLKIGPAKWMMNPLEFFEQREFRHIFQQCLSGLSNRIRNVFVFREIDGLSTEEICKALNISATNCWVMLYRARLFLRHCIDMNWFSKKNSGEEA